LLACHSGHTLRDSLISGGFAVHSACGGIAACGKCLVHIVESTRIPVTAAERSRLSDTQLDDGLRLACCIYPDSDLQVTIVQSATQTTWRALRDEEYCATLPFKLRKSSTHYGVAIDLGTTHLRLTLLNLSTGERIAGCTGLNPQSCYGADVLNRLMEATGSLTIAREMSMLVQRAIAVALTQMLSAAALNSHQLEAVFLVGNTAMLSLLAGKNFAQLLMPEHWIERIDCQPQDTGFLREAWGLAGNAAIRFVTSLGGFIGSDLLAGVIATRLIEQPAGSLLIDFGTNSEMALWDGHVLHVTSTAGGPAFEGCGISCGMAGESGAIYRVTQSGDTGFKLGVLTPSLHGLIDATCRQAEPAGLCGSGLVDAVAWLRRNGKLDKLGRFPESGSKGFSLYQGAPSVVLKLADIDVLQRAKAAIGGGVSWLCRQAGLSPAGLRKVYACGAFGQLLDVNNARQIGLLPPVADAAVTLAGNTALAGCEALLLSNEAETALQAVLAVSKVYNLAENADFEALFVENLYLQSMQE
jgi:uncharacterized 2Fe-2S/4Fe-4S cluster protein (DUF4445 family)